MSDFIDNLDRRSRCVSPPGSFICAAVIAALASALVLASQPAHAAEDDVAKPVRWSAPTVDPNWLRLYLGALESVRIEAEVAVRPLPGQKRAWIGPLSIDGGTKLKLALTLDRAPGETEAKLRMLELVSTSPGKTVSLFNWLELDRLYIREDGSIRILLGGWCFDSDRLITKVEVTPEALVFELGLLLFGQKLRITSSGLLQYRSRGFLWLGSETLGAGWVTIQSLDRIPPIKRWPPHAVDLADWLPESHKKSRPANSQKKRARPPNIPPLDLHLSFIAETNDLAAPLIGAHDLVIAAHAIKLEVHGSLVDRVFTTHPSHRSTFMTAQALKGALPEGAMVGRLDELTVNVEGDLNATIPFDDFDEVQAHATGIVGAAGSASNIRIAIPDGPRVRLDGDASARFDGKVQLSLDAGATERWMIQVAPDDQAYSLKVRGEVAVEGLDRALLPDLALPAEVVIGPAEGSDTLLDVRGSFAQRLGRIVTQLRLELTSQTRGVLPVTVRPSGTGVQIRAELAERAVIRVVADGTAGIVASASASAPEPEAWAPGANLTVSAQVTGEVSHTNVQASEVEPARSAEDRPEHGALRAGGRDAAVLEIAYAEPVAIAGALDTKVRLRITEGAPELSLARLALTATAAMEHSGSVRVSSPDVQVVGSLGAGSHAAFRAGAHGSRLTRRSSSGSAVLLLEDVKMDRPVSARLSGSSRARLLLRDPSDRAGMFDIFLGPAPKKRGQPKLEASVELARGGALTLLNGVQPTFQIPGPLRFELGADDKTEPDALPFSSSRVSLLLDLASRYLRTFTPGEGWRRITFDAGSAHRIEANTAPETP